MPLIFGVTSAGVLVPVQVDANGVVSAANHGLVGGSFQKDPIRLGYSGLAVETITDLNATTGANTLTTTVVPAGEIHIVEALSCRDNDNATTRVMFWVSVDGTNVIIKFEATAAAAAWIIWTGAITLNPGDSITASWTGCTLNDDLTLRYTARRIDIDQ